MGLTYDETMTLPLSELFDLIAVNQIKMEGFRYQRPMTEEEKLDEILKLR